MPPASIANRPRSANGVFDITLGNEQLLDVVAEFARTVSPDDPASVSERAWDRELAASTHAGSAPTARAIVMRFNAANAVRVSWRQVIETALKPQRERQQTLAAWLRADAVVDLDAPHVYYAVRRVARELGEPPETPLAYTRVRDDIVGSYRRRGMEADRAVRRLPTANQLTTWARAGRSVGPTYWDDVLTAAGYEVTPADGDEADEPRRRGGSPLGMPVPEAIVHFVRLNGYWPSNPTLRAWARDCDLPVGRLNRPWAEHRAAAEALLIEDGVELTSIGRAPTGRGNAASWLFPADGIPGAPRRSASSLAPCPRDRLVGALREFDQLVPRREGRSIDVYRRHLPGHPAWPAVSNLINNGGWSSLLAEAQALNRDGAPMLEVAAPTPTVWRDPDRIYEDAGNGLIRSSQRPGAASPDARRAEASRQWRARRREQLPPEQRRSRGRASSASLSDLVEAGLVRSGEQLIGARRDRRWRAMFDTETGALDVEGEGRFESLTAAAMHCLSGRPANGWEFWGVEREGRLVRLAALRASVA